ncbi:hypothetical protein GCM10007315_13670 [Gemmobacter tilapiae]|uniref:Uncharacterized protein n=1 Tax=Neogemmobacter tilapiae TaxID=875041 RepID=A0A918WKY3_9RHOB|nr:hypothetical protein GCM10007315_13670 [Gemmobacter tilapiae]
MVMLLYQIFSINLGGCGGEGFCFCALLKTFFEGTNAYADLAHHGRNLAPAEQDKNDGGNQQKLCGAHRVHDHSAGRALAAMGLSGKGTGLAECGRLSLPTGDWQCVDRMEPLAVL